MNFKPMLGGEADLKNQAYPCIASPKLDGVRGLVVDGKVLSRSLKPIPNAYVQKVLSPFKDLDGELIVGDCCAPDVYRKTVSAVMTQKGEPAFNFMVFDLLHSSAPYSVRAHLVGAQFPNYNGVQVADNVFIVPWTGHLIANEEQLLAYEAQCLEQGFEGLILRHVEGAYKHGRSTTREGGLLKLKRFMDSEAEILDIVELLHNDNVAQISETGHTKRSSHQENKRPAGCMGALKVRDVKSGVEFEVGTGFTQEDRDTFWHHGHNFVGRLIKYKFFPIGVKDKPRHPTYIGLRAPEDMS